MANEDTPDTAGLDPQRPLRDVRAFYRTGDDVTVATLPVGTSRVVARRATGDVVDADLGADARFADLGPGTYAIEALDTRGATLAEELMTVGANQGERPVHGFATSFEDEDVTSVLDWHQALVPPLSRCTTG